MLVNRPSLGMVTVFTASALVFVSTRVLPGNAVVAVPGHTATASRIRVLEIQVHLMDGLYSPGSPQHGYTIGLLKDVTASKPVPVGDLERESC
jgi:ABC-type dipeptide/oligopeptide/nickel transport system permease component